MIATNLAHTAPSPVVGYQAEHLPTVRHLSAPDGVPHVAVSLSGLYGAGREMLLDCSDWEHVSASISPWWQITRMPRGVEYVTCCNLVALAIAKRTSKSSALFLARYLASPEPGQVVRWANGNRLDNRQANLVAVSRSEHSRINGAANRVRRMSQWSAAAAAASQETAQEPR